MHSNLQSSTRLSSMENTKVANRLGRTEADFALDWGIFFAKSNHKEIAIQKFNEALEKSKNSSSRVLYHRAIVKRANGDITGALEDARKARQLDTEVQKYYEEEGNALLEVNELEHAKAHMHNSVEKYKKMRVDAFTEKIVILDKVFEDCMSKHLGAFMLENSKKIDEVAEIMKSNQNVDKRPSWKIRKSEGRCDITSVIEKEEEKISFLEFERRQQNFKMFTQTYMPRTWKDILYMKQLKADPILKNSKLHKFLDSKYDTTLKFVKMLEARSPLYNENGKKYSCKTYQKMHRDFIFRSQNDVHREMHIILQNIRKLRRAGNVKKMQKYIEQKMGQYVVKQNNNMLPFKVDFIYDVYNHLAIAYADNCKIPKNIDTLEQAKKLPTLLQIPKPEVVPVQQFEFKSRKHSASSSGQDAYVDKTKYFERRIQFSPFAIERCYLNYECAAMLINIGSIGEGYYYSHKAQKEANNANSPLWQFLCILCITKYHTTKGELEKIDKFLKIAQKIAKVLNSEKLLAFIMKCKQVNDDSQREKLARCTSAVSFHLKRVSLPSIHPLIN